VPTLSEAGLPGFAAYGWNAILAPKGTPRLIIDKLNRGSTAVIASPEVQARFAEFGLDVLEPRSPESATAFSCGGDNANGRPSSAPAGVKGE